MSEKTLKFGNVIVNKKRISYFQKTNCVKFSRRK